MFRAARSIVIVLGLALAVSPLVPAAGALPADRFVAMCSDSENVGNHNFCLGYVYAIAEALFAVPDKTVCFEGVSPDTLLAAVLSYIADLPEPRESDSGPLVATALANSFPCQ